jgi:hypothetical protein
MPELTRQMADAEDELPRVQPVSPADRLSATWPQRLLARVNGAADVSWLAPPQPASSKMAAKAKPGSAVRTGLVRAGMR